MSRDALHNPFPWRPPLTVSLVLALSLMGIPLAGFGQAAPATATQAETTTPPQTVPARPLALRGEVAILASPTAPPKASEPISQAQIYVQDVEREGFHKVQTNTLGRYAFPSLPAGLFRIIVFKHGFVPKVQMLLRESAGDRQVLRIELAEESGDIRDKESYWEVRAQIPADVLRDIQTLGSAGRSAPPTTLAVRGGGDGTLQAIVPGANGFQTRMKADSGYEQLGADRGNAKWNKAELGFQGELGQMAIGVNGHFQQLRSSDDADAGATSGQTHSIAVHLSSPQSSSVSLHSSGGEMQHGYTGADMAPVDVEHHRLSWSGRAGDKGRTRLSAKYMAENNYYRLGWLDPEGTPDASRTLDVEGTYSRSLGPNTSITTGLQFRQRDGNTLSFANLSDRERALLEETVGLYGVADTAIRPWVVVEYGLFSQYRDGELSLMPHGGMVLQLGEQWNARTTVAQRFGGGKENDERDLPRAFNSAFYRDGASCRSAGEACYEVLFTREGKRDEHLNVGAVHREYAETLRLYFNDEFFNRLESIFLVEGDKLQELQLQVARRLSPKILATLRSNLAEGGGGIFYATDNNAYENQVRYLVTSLDTHFQQTDTGIFVAFHHLEQALKHVQSQESGELEMQRLQLMLTQDLRVLADMAANWKLRVNMEVARGATPYSLTTDNEFYKKLTGGLSISF